MAMSGRDGGAVNYRLPIHAQTVLEGPASPRRKGWRGLAELLSGRV